MTRKFVNCRWCGNNDDMRFHFHRGYFGQFGMSCLPVCVECEYCGARGAAADTEHDALLVWNRGCV